MKDNLGDLEKRISKIESAIFGNGAIGLSEQIKKNRNAFEEFKTYAYSKAKELRESFQAQNKETRSSFQNQIKETNGKHEKFKTYIMKLVYIGTGVILVVGLFLKYSDKIFQL